MTVGNVIGFTVGGHDNNSYAFQQLEPRQRCIACNNILRKRELDPPAFKLGKRRSHAITATYDGMLVVSQGFVSLYETHALHGLQFDSLPDEPEHFRITARAVVPFDGARRGTTFDNLCPACEQNDEVIGADPVYLVSGTRIDDRGFVRTDLEFGFHDEKDYVLLCGVVAGEVLSASGLRGLELSPVYE